MGDKTGISWTDASWNPIRGCSVVSEGCKNCYAMQFASRFAGEGQAYEGLAFRTKDGHGHWTGDIMTVDKHMEDPLRWKRPRRIFVNSMSDLLHPGVPQETFDRVMEVIQAADWHIYQVLTKRPERYHLVNEWLDKYNGGRPMPQLHCGTSTENQQRLEERLPYLLAVNAVVRFLSCEPLLGPLQLAKATSADDWGWEQVNRIDDGDFPEMEIEECELEADWINYGNNMVPNPAYREHMQWREQQARFFTLRDNLHWVIVGGESGRNFRPMDLEWARNLQKQCEEAGISFFYKQGSSFKPGQDATLDGVEYHQFPSELNESAVGMLVGAK